MEGVVVSRQILVSASALTRRPVLETFAEGLQSASAAFHNQQARNGVKTSSVSISSLGFNGFELFAFEFISGIDQPTLRRKCENNKQSSNKLTIFNLKVV